MLVRPAAFSFLCCSTSASIVSGGAGGSCTSAFARSISSPSASRVMRPPDGCGVAFVIRHFASAAELRMYSWPPRMATTGLSRETVSRSRRYGSRCSLSCASCQSLLVTTISPGRLAFTRAAIAASTSAMLRARERSTPGPPPASWRCPSARPGITVWPCRSIVAVLGPASFRIAASLPTAVKRPPAIATACAIENCASTVITWPLTRIVSAGGVCVRTNAAARIDTTTAGRTTLLGSPRRRA